MPQLTIRGISVQTIKAISGPLVEELASICECGTDNFTLDCLAVTSVFGGETVETYPFIEVAWFERGGVVRYRFAEAVTRHVRLAGVTDVEVAFKVYREDAYYVSGVPCRE